jgi:hypothetical protein
MLNPDVKRPSTSPPCWQVRDLAICSATGAVCPCVKGPSMSCLETQRRRRSPYSSIVMMRSSSAGQITGTRAVSASSEGHGSSTDPLSRGLLCLLRWGVIESTPPIVRTVRDSCKRVTDRAGFKGDNSKAAVQSQEAKQARRLAAALNDAGRALASPSPHCYCLHLLMLSTSGNLHKSPAILTVPSSPTTGHSVYRRHHQ